MAEETKGTFFDRVRTRVEIDEQNYIILQTPTYGDMQEVVAKSMKFNMKAGAAPDADINMSELEILSLTTCIVDWGGPGFGKERPNRNTIMALPSWVIDKVKPKVDEITSNKEKKASTNTTS